MNFVVRNLKVASNNLDLEINSSQFFLHSILVFRTKVFVKYVIAIIKHLENKDYSQYIKYIFIEDNCIYLSVAYGT